MTVPSNPNPISTREDFKDYILRRLGNWANQINVTDDQLEDRIDDAIAYYQLYSYDASDAMFFKYTITSDDINNGFITLPDTIISVEKVLIGSFGNSLANWMSPAYQITFDAAFALASYSLVPYFITMNRLAELTFMFDNTPGIQFNQYTNQLVLNGGLGDASGLPAGSLIAMQCTGYIDPNTYTKMFTNIWLKNYATALVQKQWATNIILFSNVQLLGDVTVNADALMADANAQITALEQEMQNSFSMPPLPEIG